MNTYSVNFSNGSYFLVHAYSFRSRYSVACGCDVIEFLDSNGFVLVLLNRCLIQSLQILDYSGDLPEYRYIKY